MGMGSLDASLIRWFSSSLSLAPRDPESECGFEMVLLRLHCIYRRVADPDPDPDPDQG